MSDGAETLGQRLQAARDRKGLSAQKAADELHLDGWVIEGLESGNYERIGPAVYAKGHLKRYAELLGLPVAEVLADFDGVPPVVVPPPSPSGIRMRTGATAASALPWPAIVGSAVAALLLVGLVWWRPWHPRTAPATAAIAPESANTQPAAGGAAGAAPGGSAEGDASGAAVNGAATPGVAAPAVTTDPKAGAGRARLRLSFLADSWVDVHDAAGQRLFAGTGHVNNVRTMSGEAPFRVYLKSASAIRLEINNRVVAIGPPFVVANVAHFEAGADGVLRRDPRAAN